MRRAILAMAVCLTALRGASAWADPTLGGANAPADAAPVVNDDPWEGFNREMYKLNKGLDRAVVRPAAMGYRRALPSPLRTGVRNVLSNLGEPVVAVNDLLQGRFVTAGRTVTRFAANSTFGLGGVLDVATPGDIPHHDNSFGATLGRWGAPTGPYLYLPVLGPSTVRNAIGSAADIEMDPLGWIDYRSRATIGYTRTALWGLDTRAQVDSQLKQLLSDATDPYATLRSVYLQNQESQVHGDQLQSLPDFDESEPAAPASPAPTKPATP